jgi:hypothetical protein
MRPLGELSKILFQAVNELTTPSAAPTLRELAAHTQLGYGAARRTLENAVRSHKLKIVRWRRVSHCTKPVAEYGPHESAQPAGGARNDLEAAMSAWNR